jgi:hypothetical protein
MTHLRNHGILVVLAIAIVALPNGGQVSDVASALLSLLFAALIAYIVGRLYRDRRVEIYGLGDLERGILYASIAGIVVCFAASQEFATTGGALIEVALLGICVAGLVRVFQVWRSY